jgi:hypothetical protein
MVRLLVFNCHEGWIAQLDGLPYELDILVGLPGRVSKGWDAQARPIPSGARLVTLDDVRRAREPYDCIVLHSAADLLVAKGLRGARLLIAHNTLEGRMVEEPAAIEPDDLRAAIHGLLCQMGAHAVAISPLKARSWRLDEEDVLLPGIETSAFGPYRGTHAAGIRVANQVHLRQRILQWDLHVAAFRDLPITLVGHNPGILGAAPARSFAHLKDLLRVHRFYVHTADPALEDGYNLAMLEAMASGLPVVGNVHPSSPVRHGVEGFLSDDPHELSAHARRLLDDAPLAETMGRSARARVAECFGRARFADLFARAVQTACGKARPAVEARGGVLA